MIFYYQYTRLSNYIRKFVKMSSFEKLPTDIFSIFIQYLNMQDNYKFVKCNKLLYKLWLNDKLWQFCAIKLSKFAEKQKNAHRYFLYYESEKNNLKILLRSARLGHEYIFSTQFNQIFIRRHYSLYQHLDIHVIDTLNECYYMAIKNLHYDVVKCMLCLRCPRPPRESNYNGLSYFDAIAIEDIWNPTEYSKNLLFCVKNYYQGRQNSDRYTKTCHLVDIFMVGNRVFLPLTVSREHKFWQFMVKVEKYRGKLLGSSTQQYPYFKFLLRACHELQDVNLLKTLIEYNIKHWGGHEEITISIANVKKLIKSPGRDNNLDYLFEVINHLNRKDVIMMLSLFDDKIKNKIRENESLMQNKIISKYINLSKKKYHKN